MTKRLLLATICAGLAGLGLVIPFATGGDGGGASRPAASAIGIEGAWKIELRSPGGRVLAVRRFHNSYLPSPLLPELLAGGTTAVNWDVMLIGLECASKLVTAGLAKVPYCLLAGSTLTKTVSSDELVLSGNLDAVGTSSIAGVETDFAAGPASGCPATGAAAALGQIAKASASSALGGGVAAAAGAVGKAGSGSGSSSSTAAGSAVSSPLQSVNASLAQNVCNPLVFTNAAVSPELPVGDGQQVIVTVIISFEAESAPAGNSLNAGGKPTGAAAAAGGSSGIASSTISGNGLGGLGGNGGSAGGASSTISGNGLGAIGGNGATAGGITSTTSKVGVAARLGG